MNHKDASTYLKGIDPETFKWLEQGNELIGKDFLQQLKAHVNNNIRAGAFDESKVCSGLSQKYRIYAKENRCIQNTGKARRSNRYDGTRRKIYKTACSKLYHMIYI